MKVLLLTSAMDSGGAETHIFSLAKEMTEIGISVTVASEGGRLTDGLSRIGVEHIYLSFDRHSPIKLMETRRALCGMLRSGEYDLVHAHSRISAFLAAPIAKKHRVPFITTIHASFCLSPLYKRLSKWGMYTIAVSEDLRHYLCSGYGVCPENTRMIPNGIDTSVYFPCPEKRMPWRIVFASRLDSDCSDAAFALCSIAERLCEEYEDIEIVICGGGDMLQSVKAEADKVCERSGRHLIKVLGHIDSMAELLQSAHVFVGVSRAALEALACGTVTVLAGNEGFLGLLEGEVSIKEAEFSNFCCRGADKLTADRLFDAVHRGLSVPNDRRAELSRSCTEHIREHHSARRMAESTVKVYEEAVAALGSEGGKRIVLAGYYGFGNMGDNALLRATVRRARQIYTDADITALTAFSKRNSRYFDVRCVNRFDPFAVSRALKRSDILVFGGGTLLQDRTSLRSLIYYAALCRVAEGMGTRVELWANGLVRPETAIAEALMKGALSVAEYIGLRDMASVTEALRFVSAEVGDRLYYEPDLALSQCPSERSRVEYLHRLYGIEAFDDSRGYAVVAVKGGCGKVYLEMLERCVCELAADGIKLLFLPMFPKEDMKISRLLCERYGGVLAEGLSESDAVGIMKDARVVCGMRLHALVFASAASVPFIGIGSDPKIESFCREHGGYYFFFCE